MALDWTDKTDGVDYIMADDVNNLAHAIQDLEDNKEDISSKVTNISSSSTDIQYPSAKATYDFVMDEDGELQSGISGTYATKQLLSAETSARNSGDLELDARIDDIIDGSTPPKHAWNATNATNADVFKAADTRNDDQMPRYYMTEENAMTSIIEYKTVSAIAGLSDVLPSTYCMLKTIIPSNSISGGLPIQIAYEANAANPYIAVRAGETFFTWGTWRRITTSNILEDYAMLNQVVRYDAGQDLTDTQRQQVYKNVTRRVGQALDTPGWYRVAKMYSESGQYTLTIRSRWANDPSTVMKIFLNYSQIVDNLDACNISSFGYVSAVDKICFVRIDNYIYIDIHYFPNNNNGVSVELEGYVIGEVIGDSALIQFESQGTEAKSDMVYNLKTGMSTQGGSLYVNGTDLGGRIDDIVDGTTALPYPVTSVAGKTGAVTLSKSDVGLSNVDNTADAAKPVSTAQATAIADAKAAGTSAQSSISSHTANKSNPHAVTKAQVGLGNVDDVKQYSASNPPPYPVTSVAGKTGAVTLSKSDVGLPNVPNTDATNASNISSGSLALPRIATGLIAAGNNISVSRSSDGVYTVSAADSGATVTSVNGRSGAVTLSKSDVGLGNVDDVKQYSASNPPPYPVTSVNNKTGAVTLSKSDVGLGNVDNTADASKNVYSAQNILPNPDIYYSVNPYGRASGSTIGMYSTALGNGCEASGTNSIALGYNAKATAWISLAVGSSATASGSDAIAIGASIASGDDSIAIGQDASAYTNSVSIGYSAITSSTNSTAVGAATYCGSANSVALGYQANTGLTMNTIQLGNDNITSLRCHTTSITASDARDKTDIEDVTNALEFITALSPKTYVYNPRSKYISDEARESEEYRNYNMCEYDRAEHAKGTKKGHRRRIGLIAQDVETIMKEIYGTDNYADIVDDNFHDLEEKPENIENRYGLKYEGLIPFLIGAIKELKQEVDGLKSELNEIKNIVE